MLIEDEFTGLKLSKQRKYQLRMERDRRCTICGDEAAPMQGRCVKHLISDRERQRKRQRYKKRYLEAPSYQFVERQQRALLP